MRVPPAGISALSAFFAFGSLIACITAIALLVPGGALDPVWRLNPPAHEALLSLAPWSVALMVLVSLACGLATAGLWRLTRWGYRLALGVLAVNLVGDAGNAILRGDLHTLIGLPIGAALIAYLRSARVRTYFRLDRPA